MQLTLTLRKARPSGALRAFVEQALEEVVTREERRLRVEADLPRHGKS